MCPCPVRLQGKVQQVSDYLNRDSGATKQRPNEPADPSIRILKFADRLREATCFASHRCKPIVDLDGFEPGLRFVAAKIGRVGENPMRACFGGNDVLVLREHPSASPKAHATPAAPPSGGKRCAESPANEGDEL